MDQLAARQGGTPPWPPFDLDLAAIARGLGCEAVAIADEDGLAAALDSVVPALRERSSPLLLEVAVEPD